MLRQGMKTILADQSTRRGLYLPVEGKECVLPTAPSYSQVEVATAGATPDRFRIFFGVISLGITHNLPFLLLFGVGKNSTTRICRPLWVACAYWC